MSLLQEKSGEREKKRASEKRDSAGIPRALRLAGAGSWLGRRKRRLAQMQARRQIRSKRRRKTRQMLRKNHQVNAAVNTAVKGGGRERESSNPIGELVVRGQLSRAHFTHDLTEKVSPS